MKGQRKGGKGKRRKGRGRRKGEKEGKTN